MANCEQNKEEVGELVRELERLDGQLRQKAEFSRIVRGERDPGLAREMLESLSLKLDTLERL